MIVAAYYNLHAKRSGRPDLQWSVCAAKTRRTRGTKLYAAASLTLRNCTFVSQEGARQKVIATKQKSVHAWIVGDLYEGVPPELAAVPISYNPYRSGEFVRRDNGAPISYAAYVHFGSDGRCTAYGVR
jgi:hypothetical protein